MDINRITTDCAALMRAHEAFTRSRVAPAGALREIIQEILGYRLELRPLPPGMRALSEPRRLTIWISDSWAEQAFAPRSVAAQMAFTLAHELGHIRLHAHQLADDKGCGPVEEREANRYASEFLMPARLLRRDPVYWDLISARYAIGSAEDALATLATTYGVSRQALGIRLEELGHGRDIVPAAGKIAP